MRNMIGIDIGGTKCAVILGRETERCVEALSRESFPTEASKGPAQAIDRIIETVGKFISGCGDVQSIGVSCGGPLDSRRGLILSPPNLPGWDGIEIVKICEQRFGIPARLQNDANACALAEWRWGAAKGCRNAVFLTFGTGMGAGLILDGRLYCGTNDMAGEVGHVRLAGFGPVGYGKAGSFEGFCSGGGIAQLAGTMALERLQAGEKVSYCAGADSLGSITARAVADAAKAGDALALEVFRTCGRYLGQGLSILVDILNPEIIVIGSIFARCEELLMPAVTEVMQKECLVLSRSVCRVVPAGLGESIGDFSALSVALQD